MNDPLVPLLEEVRACVLCRDLPFGPRPVVRMQASAKILIIGQAPGTKAHASGAPWDDPSGKRLREWMAVDKAAFYDESRIAIMPMGFCYPGRLERGGDAPPRPECAPAWHGRLRAALEHVELTLLVGRYAQNYNLADRRHKTMTETVRHWKDYLPEFIPTPHPSWRTTAWLKKNPWFAAEVLPELRRRVARLL